MALMNNFILVLKQGCLQWKTDYERTRFTVILTLNWCLVSSSSSSSSWNS